MLMPVNIPPQAENTTNKKQARLSELASWTFSSSVKVGHAPKTIFLRHNDKEFERIEGKGRAKKNWRDTNVLDLQMFNMYFYIRKNCCNVYCPFHLNIDICVADIEQGLYCENSSDLPTFLTKTA